ncbi:hypothetical protein A6456_23920 [Paraburkholderia tropica]|nr:hypothetical protein A6456_23920 [Paraburkholderia tropica]
MDAPASGVVRPRAAPLRGWAAAGWESGSVRQFIGLGWRRLRRMRGFRADRARMRPGLPARRAPQGRDTVDDSLLEYAVDHIGPQNVVQCSIPV